MDLGKRIRRIRRRQGRTLQEVADACGLSRSLLSKIETGKTVPSVSTLYKTAAALGVEVPTLISDESDTQTVFTPDKDTVPSGMVQTEKGYLFHAFAAGLTRKIFQPFLFVARKGAVKAEPLSHAGEEFIYVLEGRMRYRVGSVEYRLGPGDSLYFDSSFEHDLEPLTDEVRYLGIFAEPPESGT